ncbi:PucR family transcriptional regulator [Streptomyces sp. NPDC057682]|uniref:PucR family transcriptional regulator n=1 Tax=Streptomyces sp. NPDC057682 TaxID=3346210 RepID=UPI0036CDCA3F
MKGLLLRLSALDADAATAVRVIAHFEALLGGGPDPVSLARSTAGLAGCAAGLELPDGRAARFGPGGAALRGAPVRVSGRVVLEPSGAVWLERPGAPEPFDELVLEWMAITARVLAGRPWQPPGLRPADPALVELVLSGREDVPDRVRALRLLGFSPDTGLRVVAVAGRPGTDAGVEAVALLGRGAPMGTVRVARVGALGAVLVQPGTDAAGDDTAARLREALRTRAGERGAVAPPGSRPPGSGTARPSPPRATGSDGTRPHAPAPGIRAGVGGEADPLDARASWCQARAALRFAVAGDPLDAVADHTELGPVALLADIPADRLRAQSDVRGLGRLARDDRAGQGAALLAALSAFCRTGTLRRAAAELHLHHSSVAARLTRVEKECGWNLRDPRDRFHAQLALYAWRLAEAGEASDGG